jgi:predicted acylesterase/phospholipase RssA
VRLQIFGCFPDSIGRATGENTVAKWTDAVERTQTILESVRMKAAAGKLDAWRAEHGALHSRPPEDASDFARLTFSSERVDIIFQGGGMLGAAHAGALYALEKLGFVIGRVAGTSAGALAATLAAAALHADESRPVSPQLFGHLAEMEPSTFLDGSSALRQWIVPGAKATFWRRFLKLLYTLPKALRRLFTRHGLHPARAIETWLDSALRGYGIESLADINALGDKLTVVAAAIPGGVKLLLPAHSAIFDIEPKFERPCLYARASMAVPVVFEPVVLPLDREGWTEHCDKKLKDQVGDVARSRMKEATRTVLFDGGLLSNFPVDIFDDLDNCDKASDSQATAMPAAKLTTRRIALALYSSERKLALPGVRRVRSQFLSYLSNLIDAMRALRDTEARGRLVRDRKLEVIMIDTGPANWLDFSDDLNQILNLFEAGALAVEKHFS